MKKSALLFSTLLVLGSAGLFSKTIHADSTTDNQPAAVVDSQKSPGIEIFDRGTFDNPLSLDPYNYALSHKGIETGTLTLTYNSVALLDVGFGVDKYFNLKLPQQFLRISEISTGATNFKTAIVASYRLPGHSEYTPFPPEDINTSFAGEIGFQLKGGLYLGSTTSIKIEIHFGQLLSALDLGPTFDYKTLIPDSPGGYEFRGILTSNEFIDIFPDTSARGITLGGSACDKAPTR